MQLDGLRRIANERIANETNSNWDELQMNKVSGSGQGSVRKVAVKRAGSVWEVLVEAILEVVGLPQSLFFALICLRWSNLSAVGRAQNASAGNRTRDTLMATMYSTTRPLMPWHRQRGECNLGPRRLHFRPSSRSSGRRGGRGGSGPLPAAPCFAEIF